MRTRLGFISNSSSSSFIVKAAEISLEQTELLFQQGFGFVNSWNPASLYYGADIRPVNGNHTLGLVVICNQEEVIEFLVQHEIPFKGYGQYGTESYWYKPGWDHVLVVPNPGIHMTIYGESEINYSSELKNLFHLSWMENKVPLDQFLPLEGPPTREEWAKS